jgi:hypothetical protein
MVHGMMRVIWYMVETHFMVYGIWYMVWYRCWCTLLMYMVDTWYGT